MTAKQKKEMGRLVEALAVEKEERERMEEKQRKMEKDWEKGRTEREQEMETQLRRMEKEMATKEEERKRTDDEVGAWGRHL